MVKLTREEMLQLDVRGNVELWCQLLGYEEALRIVTRKLGLEKAAQILVEEKDLKTLGKEKALEILIRERGAEKLIEDVRRLAAKGRKRGNGSRNRIRHRQPR